MANSVIIHTTMIKTYSVTINWVTPNNIKAFDIRYSITSITNENWDNAIQVLDAPAPLAEHLQNVVIALEADTLYYFGLKTIDLADNISELSNIIWAKTDILPPAYTGILIGEKPSISYLVRMNVDIYNISKSIGPDKRIFLECDCQVILVINELTQRPNTMTAFYCSGNTGITYTSVNRVDEHSWGGRYTTDTTNKKLQIFYCRRPVLQFKYGNNFLGLGTIKIDRKLMKGLKCPIDDNTLLSNLNHGTIQNESIRTENIVKFKITFTSYGNVLKSGSVKAVVYNTDGQGNIKDLKGTYKMNCLFGDHYQTDDIDIGTQQIAYFIEAQTVNLYKFKQGQYYL